MPPIQPLTVAADLSASEVAATLTGGITLTGLDWDAARRAGGGAVNLDVGGDAVLQCADPAATVSFLNFTIWDPIAGDTFGLAATAGVTASNGLNQDSIISVGGIAIGTVTYSGEIGLDFGFNASATPARVQTLLRALTYVSASDPGFIGFSAIEMYIAASDGSDIFANLNVTIAPDSAQIFTPGTDDLVGTVGAEVFEAQQFVINVGDQLDGGGGGDLLNLVGDADSIPNWFRLAWLESLGGIATIEGSGEDDNITINGAHFADIQKLDGMGGSNYLYIYGTAIDLEGKEIDGFEEITLEDDNAVVTTDSLAVAQLIHGGSSVDDVLNLTTVPITQAQRLALHRQGIDTVTAIDADSLQNETSVHHAARVTALAGDHVSHNGVNPVFLDAGRNATIAADDHLSNLHIYVSGGFDSWGKVGIDVSGSVRLSTGMVADSVVSVGSAETGFTAIGSIDYVYGTSLSIDFNTSATAARVQELIRALTYSTTETSATASRELTISLYDAGNRQTEITLTVDPQGPVAPTGISVTGISVAENATAGTGVSVLEAIDANVGDAFAYKLLDDAGGRFAISGGALVVADGSKLDFEQATSHSVTIRATDQTGRFVDQKITIAVTDVAAETIAGSDKDDVSVGGANNDTIGGGLGNDQLAGGLGSDKLSGGLGNDKLSGGLGKDVSAGGGGRDIFVFDTRLNKKTNLDKIVDFNHRDDTIHLAKSVFSKISKKGVLAKAAFWTGDKAHDASDRIVYNKKTGALFYDQDGNGSKAAIQFATLPKKLSLAANDFFVM